MARFIHIPKTVEKHARKRTLADDLIFDPFPEVGDKYGYVQIRTSITVEIEGRSCVYQLLDSNGYIVVPKGFVSDGYSIPDWLQWLAGYRHGYGHECAFLHDWMFWPLQFHKSGNAQVADDIFLWAMQSMGVNWFKRSLYHWAVRTFGDPYRNWLEWKAT